MSIVLNQWIGHHKCGKPNQWNPSAFVAIQVKNIKEEEQEQFQVYLEETKRKQDDKGRQGKGREALNVVISTRPEPTKFSKKELDNTRSPLITDEELENKALVIMYYIYSRTTIKSSPQTSVQPKPWHAIQDSIHALGHSWKA
jgi:hypothetical protein